MVTVHQFMVSHRELPSFLCKINNDKNEKMKKMSKYSYF